MNIEEYILSGILEAYALGAVSDQERREVECLSSIYPELQEALQLAQSDVETLAAVESKAPPPALRNSILRAVAAVAAEEKEELSHGDTEEVENSQKVVPLHTALKTHLNWSIGWVAAAVIAIGMFFGNYVLRETNLELQQELNQVTSELNTLSKSVLTQQERLAILADTAFTRIPMKGVEKSPNSLALIYWNATTESVLLDVRELPQPGEDQQYQLWAIVEGVPTDLGVFDLPEGQDWLEMKKVSGAAAFAVTLEPKGGLPEPTLEQLFVLGSV